jgi:hypothetical protein
MKSKIKRTRDCTVRMGANVTPVGSGKMAANMTPVGSGRMGRNMTTCWA